MSRVIVQFYLLKKKKTPRRTSVQTKNLPFRRARNSKNLHNKTTIDNIHKKIRKIYNFSKGRKFSCSQLYNIFLLRFVI